MSDNVTTSAYIHIPFCKSKCNYCSFISGVNLEKKGEYLSALSKEIDYYYHNEKIKTLYIGGGTPSVLTANELSTIVDKFRLEKNCEVTVELNPNDINPDYLSSLKDIGVNRLSIGAQTFDDKILKLIGRRHGPDEIYNSVEIARKAGFSNISLDLIYGLPEQTIEGFKKDLTEIIRLNPEHLSLYGLKIDKGCYFYTHMPDNLPDEDTQADMYLIANEITSEAGYNHYEVSNYSKPGYESAHNTNYWRCGNYYGFGLSAHGYDGKIRYSNTSELLKYIDTPIKHETEKELSQSEKLEERIFLGLRLAEGVNVSEINSEFGIDFDAKYKTVLDKYLPLGYLKRTKTGYALSNSEETNGFLLSNIILSEFLS